LFRRRGWWRTLRERLFWIFWMSWVHDWVFSDQDKRLLEKVIPGKELPSRSDIGVVAWRRYAVNHARRRAEAGTKRAVPASGRMSFLKR